MMKRSEYLRRAKEAYNSGRVSEEAYDAMIENADVFSEPDDDEDWLPDTYAEVEYTSEMLEYDPEAIRGAIWDDMNYRYYTER